MAPPLDDARRLASRLRFRHLQLLLALEQGGSLRAAAQALNFTQPALSKALAEVEAAFGLPLFTRTPRGLTPTAQGLVTLRGARLLLQELAHVQAEAGAAGAAAAIVRVGAPPFVAHGYLPEVLLRLASAVPRVHVQLLEERVPMLLEALADGRLDALVSSYPADTPASLGTTLRYEKLFDSEFVVIAPPAHPLARVRRVDWVMLAQHDWIMPARTSMVRRVIEDHFARAGAVPPLPLVESTSPVTNLQLVAAGIALAVVPVTTLSNAAMEGRVTRLRVSPAIAPGPVALISRAGPPNPRVDLLREALLAVRVPGPRRVRYGAA
jgi:LysR family transcriptional regulator, regulator of abg operon